MTILSDKSIFYFCRNTGFPMIDPFFGESKIHEESGLSYGLQPCAYDLRVRETININESELVLASTMELVCIPNDVCAFVHDKSTWARQGLVVQNTHVDPGFRGVLTIELTNHGRQSLKIVSGTPICQLIFHRLDMPAVNPYTGRYQNQEPGPQPARRTAT
jgi:dCTP deaminase